MARVVWHRLEAVNAVAYFCEECRERPEAMGLAGFWMGYFACRAAPMGAVGAGVVEATFFNFHPGRVRRAIPEAWTRVDPAELTVARAEAAAAALRRVLTAPAAERLADQVLPALGRVVEACSTPGRPLFAANRDVEPPSDPVAALWQAATTLREHRGDAHVALLTGAGLDGCEAHALFALDEEVPAELYLQSRGWTPEDWEQAVDRLTRRGLVSDGAITDTGRDLRAGVEAQTDRLALHPYHELGDEGLDDLLRALAPAAARISSAGEIRYPNPMGLPKEPGTTRRL